ncbi:hypothetical protein [Microbispora sp. NPDC049125]|uniref:hypothetical protein n=1 Tax=Microbispora sp. NPDC049125 TaxID=3154929 RepID=UPI00346686CA
MDEFTAELHARLRETRAELRKATESGDDHHGVEVLSSRLDALRRIAEDHDIPHGGDDG